MIRPSAVLLVCCVALTPSPAQERPEPMAQERPEPVATASGEAASQPGAEERIRAEIQNRVRSAAGAEPPTASRERLHAGSWLESFYSRRGYAPAWSREAAPTVAVDSLLGAIRSAELEGLRPADYHQAALIGLLLKIRYQEQPDPADLAELDLLATDAFLTYAAHLLAGVVDPTTLGPITAAPREIDLPARLAEALEHGRVQESFRELLFAFHPGYFRLRSALARYRSIADSGGWPSLPEGDTLWPADRGANVAVLRARLATSGDLLPGASAVAEDPFVFDSLLEVAVRRFQRRHGLAVDGVVGPATLGALNVPADERVRQLELNMERWRWLPIDLGSRYILVNTAAFQVEVFEHSRPVLRLRAIVGKEYRQSPVFSDTMTYLVLNPSWTVPRGLAVREKLPLFREDPEAIHRLGYRIYEHWGSGAPEVDPDTIDWSELSADRFREFRLWQASGPHNALGQVKFMFPNAFDVYLHDTPERGLFDLRTRDFSSGCIRVENALDLAAYLLRDQEGWPRERIDHTVTGNRETTISLARPIPIHIQYWTAWTEPDGTVQFRSDLYGRDGRLASALQGEPRGVPGFRFR